MDEMTKNSHSPLDETRYCFVSRLTMQEKMQFGLVPVIVLLLPSLFIDSNFTFWLFLVGTLSLLHGPFCHFRQSVLVDSKGITSCWKGWPLSKHLAWGKIAQICLEDTWPGGRLTKYRRSKILPPENKCLLLIDANGNLLQQLDFLRNGALRFVGEGHSLCLAEAIEKFHPIKELTVKEREKILQQWDGPSIGGKEADRIAYASVVLVLLAFPLSFFSHTRALETVENQVAQMAFYWALGAFLVAVIYLWQGARDLKAALLSPILGLLFGGACGFLMVLLVEMVPAWSGDARSETFVIVHEDEKTQHWQGASAPELAFTLFMAPEARAYRKMGTRETFTLYHGPFGLLSMEDKEFRTLFRSGKNMTEAKQ